MIKGWEKEYHVDKTGDVIFQNKKYTMNVRFTNESLNAVKKNPRGLDHLPDAISNPDELWGRWDDTSTQRDVIFNYILSDETHIFVVQTKAGVIFNTKIDTTVNINNYRKGIIFVK